MNKRRRKRAHTFPPVTGSTSARGYGSRHQAERRRWKPLVDTGTVCCVRCGFLIPPGARFHLDHADDGLHYLGPAHATCNVKAAAKRGNALAREKRALGLSAGSVRSASR